MSAPPRFGSACGWRRAGRVVRFPATSWGARGAEVAIGDNVFTAVGSAGCVGDVEWDLRFAAGSARVAPAMPLLSPLHPFDLELVSRPRVVFDGRVSVGGERFNVAGVEGSLTHYWGRRLPDSWRWVSAGGFGGTDRAVESVLMRSRLWGTRPALTAGYLWMGEHDREHLLISPATGLLTAHGSPTDFVLVGRSRCGVRLHCSAGVEDFNDLGEGIHQTLRGTCSIAEHGWSSSTVGLEYRNLSRRPGRYKRAQPRT